MLKRVLVFLVIVGCVSQFCAGINSYAREVNDSNAVVEQVYEDGSYIESTVHILPSDVLIFLKIAVLPSHKQENNFCICEYIS